VTKGFGRDGEPAAQEKEVRGSSGGRGRGCENTPWLQRGGGGGGGGGGRAGGGGGVGGSGKRAGLLGGGKEKGKGPGAIEDVQKPPHVINTEKETSRNLKKRCSATKREKIGFADFEQKENRDRLIKKGKQRK